ncbi:MAG TPA: circadian clock KaiB family protein [Pirellulales bacterium]|jgi:circadian clock protein KaiB|nr:circadian clock KaiB family protein [Pirellulales bacterium]
MSQDEERPIDSVEDFEHLAADSTPSNYVLRLYVSGMTPRSTEAVRNLTTICEEHLKDHYELEVIDIYKQPAMATTDQIIATPTLVKTLPLPLRKLVGTLSNEERVLVGLNLVRKR